MPHQNAFFIDIGQDQRCFTSVLLGYQLNILRELTSHQPILCILYVGAKIQIRHRLSTFCLEEMCLEGI